MDIDKMNVNVPTDYNGSPIHVVISEGKTPALNEPRQLNKIVTLGSIAALILAGKFDKNPKDNKAMLFYNLQPEKLGMDFYGDPTDALAVELHAKLEINPDFLAWGINKDHYFSGKDLQLFCRRYAHCFADPKQAMVLVNALRNFEVKFEQVHKEEDDRKGNTDKQLKTSLNFAKGEVPTEWLLTMPLFKATEPVTFKVEIEIEARNGYPTFGFYSLESDLLLKTTGETIVMNEVNKFSDYVVSMEQQ
jgi:hypothetical protein